MEGKVGVPDIEVVRGFQPANAPGAQVAPGSDEVREDFEDSSGRLVGHRHSSWPYCDDSSSRCSCIGQSWVGRRCCARARSSSRPRKSHGRVSSTFLHPKADYDTRDTHLCVPRFPFPPSLHSPPSLHLFPEASRSIGGVSHLPYEGPPHAGYKAPSISCKNLGNPPVCPSAPARPTGISLPTERSVMKRRTFLRSTIAAAVATSIPGRRSLAALYWPVAQVAPRRRCHHGRRPGSLAEGQGSPGAGRQLERAPAPG